MDATMWHRDHTNSRRCLLILNGLRVLMEWAWLFCTSVCVCLMYLFVWLSPARDGGDHTLFFGLRRPWYMRLLLSPFRTSLGFVHTTWLFFLLFHLLFCSWFWRYFQLLVPSSWFSKVWFEICIASIISLRPCKSQPFKHQYISFHEMIWSEVLWAVPCVAAFCVRFLVWHILYQIYLEPRWICSC